MTSDTRVENKAGRYYLVSGGRRLTVADVLKSSAADLSVPLFACLAAASARRRFYWLWRDIDPATADRDIFWFCLKTARIPDITDFGRFRDKVSALCHKKLKTMVFVTPTGKRLVCPCPDRRGKKAYGNISLFAMNASHPDKKALLARLLNEIRHEKTPFRVRTHGHDVPWLHVRIEKI